jgi:hypothetical protein
MQVGMVGLGRSNTVLRLISPPIAREAQSRREGRPRWQKGPGRAITNPCRETKANFTVQISPLGMAFAPRASGSRKGRLWICIRLISRK